MYEKFKFVTVLLDSTTDVAHLKQMASLLKYVVFNNEDDQRFSSSIVLVNINIPSFKVF